jgi:hypothetical protein
MEYPRRIYANGKSGSNGIKCLDYQNYDDDVLYIRCDNLGCLLELAFDSGYDAGLHQGFENANKANSRQITKPIAMTFKQFIEQNRCLTTVVADPQTGG